MYPWQPSLLYHHSYPKLPTSENTLNYGVKRLGLMAFNEAWDSDDVIYSP